MNQIIAVIIFFTTLTLYAKDPETIRKEIFGIYAHQSACKPIKYEISKGVSELDPEFDKFIKEMLEGIKSGKTSSQIGLFHPRLKISATALDPIIASEKTTLGFPFETSIYRIFALNTVDGSPGALFCSEDEIKIWPQYGYPLQFGVWIQILGQTELGRIYATVVPKDGKWWIGAFHYHQWTHDSKDYEAWFYESQKDLKNKNKELAYAKMDLSLKLIDSNKEFHLPVSEQIKSFQKRIMERDAFESGIKKLLSDWNIIYTSTMFAKGGVGLVVRILNEKELSGNDIEKTCKDIATKLSGHKGYAELNGVRCSYVLKGEPTDKEGFMGGLYVSFDDIKKK